MILSPLSQKVKKNICAYCVNFTHESYCRFIVCRLDTYQFFIAAKLESIGDMMFNNLEKNNDT